MVDDQWALVRAQKASIAQYIELSAGLRGEKDRAILQSLFGHLAFIADHALADSARAAFEAFVASIWRPEHASLGWERRADDSSDERERRSLAISALGRYANDRSVRAEARRRLDAHLGGRERLDPDIAGAVVSAAAVDGDNALFDRYVQRMKDSEKSDAQEEARFRGGLAQFRDPAVVERLAKALFADLVREQDLSMMLGQTLGLPHARLAGWRAVKANWDAKIATQDPGGKHRAIGAVGMLTPKDLMPEVIAFLEEKRSADSEETITRTVERLRISSAVADRIAAELPGALEKATEKARV